jgi:hypothetical protein
MLIESLVIVVIILIAIGLIIWALQTYLPTTWPAPWKGLIIILVALIGALLILAQVGVVNLGHI